MKLLRLVFAFGMTVIAYGQTTGGNVVSALAIAGPITMSSGSSNLTVVSTQLQNIGQTSHTAIAVVTAGIHNVTVTCTIEGSADGTNYFNIGVSAFQVLFPLAGGTTKCFGYGAYPSVRVKIQLVAVASYVVPINVTYSGTSTSSNVLVDSGGANMNMTAYNVALITGSSVLQGPVVGQGISIYGIQVYSQDATATSIILTCTTGTQSMLIGNIGTAKTIIMPESLRPYMTCIAGDSLTATYVGTTLQTQINISLRFE